MQLNIFMMRENKKGFTLIELLIVIAIIGILSGVIVTSSRAGVEKAKRASALSTASSLMTELVACADDGGVAKSTQIAAGNYMCCVTNSCAAKVAGHDATWPDIATSSGWDYKAAAPTGAIENGDYSFALSRTEQADIVCDMTTGSCS